MLRITRRHVPALSMSLLVLAACGAPEAPRGFPSGGEMGLEDLASVEEDTLVSTMGLCPAGREPFAPLGAQNGRQVRYVAEQQPVVGLFDLGETRVDEVLAAARVSPLVCSAWRARLELDADVAADVAAAAEVETSAVVALLGADGGGADPARYRRVAVSLGDGRLVLLTTGDVGDDTVVQQVAAAVRTASTVQGVPRR